MPGVCWMNGRMKVSLSQVYSLGDLIGEWLVSGWAIGDNETATKLLLVIYVAIAA